MPPMLVRAYTADTAVTELLRKRLNWFTAFAPGHRLASLMPGSRERELGAIKAAFPARVSFLPWDSPF